MHTPVLGEGQGCIDIDAARDIARALRPRHDGKRPREGPRFHVQPRDGEKVIVIELGIEAEGETDLFYFSFDGVTIHFPDEGHDLLRLIEVLGRNLDDMWRASLGPSPAIPQFTNLGERYQPKRWDLWRPPHSV